MTSYKKIRGHHKIWKNIDSWVSYNKKLDLEYLQSRKREYVKVWVQPYSNISVLNSEFKPPKYKTRKKIIEGIFEIYNSWKNQLDSLNKPYYLKIWFFPEDVSKCQVVCAIDDFIDFYDVTFYKPKINKPFPFDKRGLNWQYCHQEHHLTIKDIDEPESFYSYQDYLDNKKWIEAVIKNPKTRISEYNENETLTTYYSIKEYDVWVGGN